MSAKKTTVLEITGRTSATRLDKIGIPIENKTMACGPHDPETYIDVSKSINEHPMYNTRSNIIVDPGDGGEPTGNFIERVTSNPHEVLKVYEDRGNLHKDERNDYEASPVPFPLLDSKYTIIALKADGCTTLHAKGSFERASVTRGTSGEE